MGKAKPGWAMTRRVATLFWLAFTGVAMLQAWTYWESSGREAFDARQERSQRELTEVRAVWTGVMEATSAARGYAFTGDGLAKESYVRAAGDLRGRLGDLQKLAGDVQGDGALHGRRQRSATTAEADATAELVKVVNGVLAELDAAVAGRDAGGQGAAAAARAAEPTWQDGGLLQRTRELVREIEADEEAGITRYADAERASVRRNRALFATVTLVDVALAGLAFWALGRFLDQRRRAEEGLERARAVAENAREVAEKAGAEAVRANLAKDRVLATVSHDLRTPLNGILMWAQVLQGRGLEPSEGDVAEAADAIASSARAQARLIDDLLDAARVAHGTLRLEVGEVKLAEVVREACAAVSPGAEARGVRMVCDDTGADGVCVRGDAFRLRQVMWNLLSNAVKFTPAGGEVRAELSADAEGARVRVTDSGAGIAAELLPHVFEAFRQGEGGGRGKPHGLGLGLAIVKHVVELHGGRVEARSAGVGRGATFEVVLPIGERDSVKRENPGVGIPGLGVR